MIVSTLTFRTRDGYYRMRFEWSNADGVECQAYSEKVTFGDLPECFELWMDCIRFSFETGSPNPGEK